MKFNPWDVDYREPICAPPWRRPPANLTSRIRTKRPGLELEPPRALAARPAGGRLEGAPGRPRGHITGVRGHIAEVRKPGALAAHPGFRGGRAEFSPDPV